MSRRLTKLRRLSQAGAILASTFLSVPAIADTGAEVLTEQIDQLANKENVGLRSGSVVVAPIPFRNELVGAGLALGFGYLLKTDQSSDTSIIGVGTLRSENGSTATALSANFAFNENKWKLSLTAGEADMFYDLYIGSLRFPVRQDGIVLNTQGLRAVDDDTFAGARLRYLDTTLAYVRSNSSAPNLPLITAELVSLSALFQIDTRDDTFSARSGYFLDLDAMYGELLNRSDSHYHKFTARYTGYRPLGDRSSLAFRVTGCVAADKTPFFDKCSIGGTDGFRGFNPTRYLNSRLLSFQAEVRHNFTNRISGVAFAGAGFSGPTFEQLDNAGANVAYGIGARYQISKNFKAMFSVDVARNDAGEDTLYVYVGQRF
ncbi:surface antigen-like protein [Shimia isoporae]|uniref:Surface antigen-like protein n=1 Tax=Shimia isoporae TaxID=647720 RepID=A0A4R1NMW0_9RHOB|nr:BamA/TamA family outer membrane protein [Shimia isoporae]TCL09674.1 surface antigen-like protein [Shimia isoporae]